MLKLTRAVQMLRAIQVVKVLKIVADTVTETLTHFSAFVVMMMAIIVPFFCVDVRKLSTRFKLTSPGLSLLCTGRM